MRFDFPLLTAEILRHRLSCASLQTWRFVDTLAVLQGHGCSKLQCLALRVTADTGRQHRAIDDCVTLRQVVVAMAQGLGTTLPSLLLPYALEVDLPSSLAQLSVLMGLP